MPSMRPLELTLHVHPLFLPKHAGGILDFLSQTSLYILCCCRLNSCGPRCRSDCGDEGGTFPKVLLVSSPSHHVWAYPGDLLRLPLYLPFLGCTVCKAGQDVLCMQFVQGSDYSSTRFNLISTPGSLLLPTLPRISSTSSLISTLLVS